MWPSGGLRAPLRPRPLLPPWSFRNQLQNKQSYRRGSAPQDGTRHPCLPSSSSAKLERSCTPAREGAGTVPATSLQESSTQGNGVPARGFGVWEVARGSQHPEPAWALHPSPETAGAGGAPGRAQSTGHASTSTPRQAPPSSHTPLWAVTVTPPPDMTLAGVDSISGAVSRRGWLPALPATCAGSQQRSRPAAVPRSSLWPLSCREGHGAQRPVTTKGRRAPDPRLCHQGAAGKRSPWEDGGRRHRARSLGVSSKPPSRSDVAPGGRARGRLRPPGGLQGQNLTRG